MKRPKPEKRPAAAPPLARLQGFVQRREVAVVAAITVVALLLRGLHVWQAALHDPFFFLPAVDPKVYHEWAIRIADGDWLGDQVFFLSPLYPYFLSAIYAVTGPSLLAAKIIQAVLSAGCCLLIHLIGRRVFGILAGVIAAALWALYSLSIFYDTELLVAAIQTPLNLAVALFLLRAERTGGRRSWLAAGVLLGLSTLARPNTLLLAGLIVPWGALALRGRFSRGAVALRLALFGAGMALMVAPVTVRNHVVGDDFVLVSSQSGANLYIGNGPGAAGTFRVPAEFLSTRADDPLQQQRAYREHAERARGRPLKPSEISDYWTERALEHVVEHPADSILLLLRKTAMFFNHHEPGNSRDFYSSRRFSAILALPLLDFSVVGSLGLLGLIVSLRIFRRAFVLYAMVAVYAASLVLFFVLAHYRMPITPFFALFAGGGAVFLLEALAGHRFRALLLGLSLLAGSAWFVHLDLYRPGDSRFMVEYNLANRYRMLGRRPEAIDAYRRSIELQPNYISSHHNLAIYCGEEPRDLECAEREWKAVLAIA
ncbi:MAG TPA: glycosyltransferase family 39 protein, partial [Polyangia bacterium]|nr:glycosyltransferase family 39 protein [Polyangia bacterium]